MNKKHLLLFFLFCFSIKSSFAQSSLSAELISYQTFGEGLMVTKAKIPAVSGLVSNFFFFNREDEPWNDNEWYEYDWEIRGAYPKNGWSQIRVRPEPGGIRLDSPRNSAATINIGNSMLHWILIRKGNDYIYDIRRDFDINTYNYNNAAAHGGNSISLMVGGPRVFTTGRAGDVDHIPSGKRLDFSLGVTAFDNGWSGFLPSGAYSADFVIDFTRFYGFSGNNLNTTPQWQDEFNQLDYDKWQIANWTFGDTKFTQNNIRFEDGKMILTANRNNGAGGNSNTNLALNGTASQSSTSNGGNPSRAIDNNTNGNWSGGSVTHTNNAVNSWWQVDLGADADLDRIEIFNRTNCCSDRLSDFSVSVLDADDKIVWTRFYSNPPSPSLNINLDAIGQKVRVNLDGILSLAEVRVFGTGGNPNNDGNADDGNTDGGYTDGGNTDGGSTDGGNTDGGNTDGGNTDGGNTDDGNTDGGSTDDGNTDGGSTDDGNTDGGSTDGGNTDGGSTDGGNTDNAGETVTESCDNGTSIIYGNGTITMQGGSYFQVFDANWQEVFNCGWQCGTSQTVDNLAAGDYRVLIKDNAYQNICEKVITLSTGGSSGGNNAEEEEETDGGTTDGGTTDNGTTDGGTTDGGTTITCGEVAITYGNGNVTFIGLPNAAYFFKINDLDNGWADAGSCGWNCGNEFTVNNLSNGRYLLTVYNSNWSIHCDTEITMTGSSFASGATNRQAPHLSFVAYPANRTVDLQWLSNSGYKVHNFEVEHSNDGVNFEAMANLVNKDWSSDIAYHHIKDEVPLLGSNYYRVKEVYLDGSFAYTDVQQVNFQINLTQISVFPNPAQDELFLNLNPYVGKKVRVSLVNNIGQQLIQQDIASISSDLITINTNQIQNGLYYLLIEMDGLKPITKKVMIHRFY